MTHQNYLVIVNEPLEMGMGGCLLTGHQLQHSMFDDINMRCLQQKYFSVQLWIVTNSSVVAFGESTDVLWPVILEDSGGFT